MRVGHDKLVCDFGDLANQVDLKQLIIAIRYLKLTFLRRIPLTP
jgi:hypothetical protein